MDDWICGLLEYGRLDYWRPIIPQSIAPIIHQSTTQLFQPYFVGANRMSSSIWFEANPSAFDTVAVEYDGIEARNAIMSWMRLRVQAAALSVFSPGSRLLEAGCGTGTDALFFAQQGYHVVAADPSAEMLAAACVKISAAGYAHTVDFVRSFAEHLLSSLPASSHPFDGLFSNFGALNCLADLRPFAHAAARLLRPGAKMLINIMPPVCPWEIFYYLSKRKPTQAFRRWCGRTKNGGIPVAVHGRLVQTYYHSAQEIRRACAGHFSCAAQFALGLFMPPPYLQRVAEHRRLLKIMQRMEERLASWPFLRGMGDHFVMILQRH